MCERKTFELLELVYPTRTMWLLANRRSSLTYEVTSFVLDEVGNAVGTFLDIGFRPQMFAVHHSTLDVRRAGDACKPQAQG